MDPIKQYKEYVPGLHAYIGGWFNTVGAVRGGGNGKWTVPGNLSWSGGRLEGKGRGVSAKDCFQESETEEGWSDNVSAPRFEWSAPLRNSPQYLSRAYQVRSWNYNLPSINGYDTWSVGDENNFSGSIKVTSSMGILSAVSTGSGGNPYYVDTVGWNGSMGWGGMQTSPTERKVFVKRSPDKHPFTGSIKLSGEVTALWLLGCLGPWVGQDYEQASGSSGASAGFTSESGHWLTGGSRAGMVRSRAKFYDVAAGKPEGEYVWDKPFTSRVCVVRRKNTPLPPGLNSVGGAYVNGYARVSLSGAISGKIWKDAAGIFDNEMSALDAVGWAPGGNLDLPRMKRMDFYHGVALAQIWLRSSSAQVYRLTMQVMNGESVRRQYFLTVGPEGVVLGNEDGGGDTLGGTTRCFKVERETQDGWKEVPYEPDIVTVEVTPPDEDGNGGETAEVEYYNAMGKLIGHDPTKFLITCLYRLRYGRRWGFEGYGQDGTAVESRQYYKTSTHRKHMTP